MNYFLIGKVLLAIKNKTHEPALFTSIVKNMKFSKSYAYFLVNFALLSITFPKLKTVCRPIREIKNNFAKIKSAVERDAGFWM